jgi:hypothetical protein
MGQHISAKNFVLNIYSEAKCYLQFVLPNEYWIVDNKTRLVFARGRTPLSTWVAAKESINARFKNKLEN